MYMRNAVSNAFGYNVIISDENIGWMFRSVFMMWSIHEDVFIADLSLS
jgi:uncharacterized heparinase superfamily protein